MFSSMQLIFGTLFLLSVSSDQLASSLSNELFVVYSERAPFVVKQQNGVLTGLDVSIIEHFAKKINHTIKYSEQSSTIMDIFNKSNHSSDQQKIDIFIGALDGDLLQNDRMIASRAYYHDALTWCVPLKQPVPSWKTFFYICKDPIVYALFTFMCTSVIFTGYFMQQYEDLQPKWDWFRITISAISPCLGFVSMYRPKIIPNRIFFVMSFFGATLACIVLNSFIMIFIQFPVYEDQIKSTDEILYERFDLVGDQFALRHLRNQIEVYPLDRLENFHVCNNLNECLLQLKRHNKMAVAIFREFVRNSRYHSQVYCFEGSQIIHEYSLKFMVHRDFPYLEELNAFIAAASAGGLVERWHSGRNSRFKKLVEYNYITFDSFKSTFTLWIIGFVLMVFFLLLEIIVNKGVNCSNMYRFWVAIERLIDPQRHYWLETKLLNGHPAF